MTFDELKTRQDLLLLDSISGSRAYNLDIPGSDTDRKGIFITPRETLFGFSVPDQVENHSHDEVYFEVRRFLELLTKNNPNILELLNLPGQMVRFRHPLMDLVKTEDFLSKLCMDTFAGYAQSQIKKARGANKKRNRPVEAERKSIIDFCYVIHGRNSMPLKSWLALNQLEPSDCGLQKPEHFRDVYLLYHQSQLPVEERLRGITSGPEANDVHLSTVPKNIEPLAVMNFNKDGYSTYCKEYREYREWELKRNDLRYQSTLAHGQSYDAKNMMHTFRLLNMADEIARLGEVIVYRHDRDFLLRVRRGEFTFDKLMGMIEEKMEKIGESYATSSLPERPDPGKAESLLVEIREIYYDDIASR